MICMIGILGELLSQTFFSVFRLWHTVYKFIINNPPEPCQKAPINHIQEYIFNFHIYIYEIQELEQVA